MAKKRKKIVEPKRKITRLIIHCTATGDYPPGHLYYDRIGAKQIREWHMRPTDQGGRNFDDIGYHYVIRRTGVLETGRPEYMIGAHTFGHNLDSIGIAWVGTRHPTDDQMTTLRLLVKDLLVKHRLWPSDVHGHNEYAAKECPGFDLKTHLIDYLIEEKKSGQLQSQPPANGLPTDQDQGIQGTSLIDDPD